MPITVENEYSGSGKKITSVTISSVVVPTSSNRAIYVVVSGVTKNNNDGKYATGITFNGTENFTKLGEAQNSQGTVAVWYLLNPTQTTADIVVTYVDNNATWEGTGVGVQVLSGVDVGGTPHDTWQTPSSGTGTSSSHTINTATDDYCLDVVALDDTGNVDTLTESGVGTLIWTVANGKGDHGSADFVATGSTAVMAWSWTNSLPWIHGGVSVNPVSVGVTEKSMSDSGSGSDVMTIPWKQLAKSFTDVGSGSDVFTKATILQAKAFVDAIGGSDVFENLYRAMSFIDSISGADVFTNAIVQQAKAFVDTVAGTDAFTLLRFLDFVDTISGADVWTLTRPMDFVDTISGADVFTKATILQLKDFADTIAGSDVFTIPFRAMGFIDTIDGSDVFDVTLFKAFSDAIGGVDVWTLTRPMYFSDSITGTDVFVIPYKEMGFVDTVAGADIFELLRFLAFTDTVTGSDVFSLLREFGFTDTIGGADVFTIPYREMGFSDTITGSEVFSTPYKEMGITDTILGTDVFSGGDISGIIQKVMVDSGSGYDVFTHVALIDFVDAMAGTDVFLVTKPEIIVKISDGDFSQVGITDGDLYQILITDGALSQVKITEANI